MHLLIAYAPASPLPAWLPARPRSFRSAVRTSQATGDAFRLCTAADEQAWHECGGSKRASIAPDLVVMTVPHEQIFHKDVIVDDAGMLSVQGPELVVHQPGVLERRPLLVHRHRKAEVAV